AGSGAGPGPAFGLDLGWVVPRAVPCERGAEPAALTWWSGVAVGEGGIGREATLEDLARFAALLAGHAVADGTWVEVQPSSADLERHAHRSGVQERLLAAGGPRLRGRGPRRPPR